VRLSGCADMLQVAVPVWVPGCQTAAANGGPTTAPSAGCRLSQCWDHRRSCGAFLRVPTL
jgi:hypothetical protein